MFFDQLTERRWRILESVLGVGQLPLREVARRVGRDVKRVSKDVAVLAEMGRLVKRPEGGVLCPYSEIHIDLHTTKR